MGWFSYYISRTQTEVKKVPGVPGSPVGPGGHSTKSKYRQMVTTNIQTDQILQMIYLHIKKIKRHKIPGGPRGPGSHSNEPN